MIILTRENWSLHKQKLKKTAVIWCPRSESRNLKGTGGYSVQTLIQKVMLIVGIVLLAVSVGQIDHLQMWVWKAQAKLIMESLTSNWGSRRFFRNQRFTP